MTSSHKIVIINEASLEVLNLKANKKAFISKKENHLESDLLKEKNSNDENKIKPFNDSSIIEKEIIINKEDHTRFMPK